MLNILPGHAANSGLDYQQDNTLLCEVIDCVDDCCKDAIDLTTIDRRNSGKVCLH